jgi:hypothetical protein
MLEAVSIRKWAEEWDGEPTYNDLRVSDYVANPRSTESPVLLKSEGSLLYSQATTIGPHPEDDKSNPQPPPTTFKVHFINSLPPTPMSSKCFFP